MDKIDSEKTTFYAEYNSYGPGGKMDTVFLGQRF